MMANQPQPKKAKVKFTRPSVAEKHKRVLTNLVENGGNLGKAIRDTGLYSESVAETPTKILNSKTWNELVEEVMPDSLLSEVHTGLLRSTRLDHMVFPLGPKGEDDENFSGAQPNKESSEPEQTKERTSLTDKEIVAMLAETGCTVRRIVHGETARHVYFWAPDNMARDKALDKGYKLKGRYGSEGVIPPRGNTYNFIFSAPVQERVNEIESEIKKLLTQQPST